MSGLEDQVETASTLGDAQDLASAVVVASDRTTARWAWDLDDDLVDVGPLGLAVDQHDDARGGQ